MALSAIQNSVDAPPNNEVVVTDYTETNIGLLVVRLQLAVENGNNQEISACIQEIEKYKRNCELLTQFLDRLEADLQNPETKKISLLGDRHLFEQVKAIHTHPSYEKTELTRGEAEALVSSIHRKLEIVAREIQRLSQDSNRLMENRQQLVDIFKTLLQLLERLFQTLTRNQRG